MATPEEELRKRLKSSTAERLGRATRAGVDVLGSGLAKAGGAVADTVKGVGAGISTAATLAGKELEESVGTPLGEFARGFTGSTPSPTTTSPNQRNQAAAGTAGTTTGDASGTGVNARQVNPNSPVLGGENVRTIDPTVSLIEDRTRALGQRNADRGFETQTTQFGATAADGSPIPRGRGTFSAVGSSRTPQAQLAELRKTFDSPGGRTGTGGFAVAPDSRTRDRNARIQDPRRQFISDLQRQVRRGAISARAAGGIAANLLGQQQDATTARERIAAEQAKSREELGFRREQLASEADIAGRKIESEAAQSALDRAVDISTAEQRAAQQAARLGLDVEELGERQRSNLSTEQIARDRLRQQELLGVAGLEQKERLAGLKSRTSLLGEVGQILSKVGLGEIATDQAAGTLTQMFGPDVARQLLAEAGTGLFEPIEPEE